MAEFVKNAIMLYRYNENGVEIEGKNVEYKVFDKDDHKFETDSVGWVTSVDLIEDVPEADTPKRGRPARAKE